jgi:hypothetical protein
MKTKTVSLQDLSNLVCLLQLKKETAAAAAKAAKDAKEACEALGLPSESVLLKSPERELEVMALFNQRNVREIPARIDSFHSYTTTKCPSTIAFEPKG